MNGSGRAPADEGCVYGTGVIAAKLACSRRKRAIAFSTWVFFLISLGGQAPHVRCIRPMGRARRGGPNEMELTPIGVALNGSRRVPAAT